MPKDLNKIDFSKINENLKDGQKQARAGDAEIFWKNWFESKLLSFIQAQLIAMATEGEKITFKKGTINGLFLIMEWFEKQIKLSHSKFDTNEEEPPLGDI